MESELDELSTRDVGDLENIKKRISVIEHRCIINELTCRGLAVDDLSEIHLPDERWS